MPEKSDLCLKLVPYPLPGRERWGHKKLVKNQTAILGSKKGKKWPKMVLKWQKNMSNFIFLGPAWSQQVSLNTLKIRGTLYNELIIQ